MKKNSFQQCLTDYLSKYLTGHLGASTNTVKSYRDTFSLLLRYCRDELKIKPERLDFNAFNRKLVENFLHWLEHSRHCSASTRNQRLAAIHAFSRYVMVEEPENAGTCQAILSILVKKAPAPAICYMTVEGIRAVLAEPFLKSKIGIRDLALLTLLYESGARVQEIIDVTCGDVRLTRPATVKLTGKGNKSRIVPLMPDAAKIIETYLDSIKKSGNSQELSMPLFVNRKGEKLSRSGVTYIINKYVRQARKLQPQLLPTKVTPHVFRHSKAMHLLEANVNIIYIRDLLGHASVQTTEMYAKASPDAKRKALEKASAEVLPHKTYSKEKEDELLTWLKELA
jgi:site-specific recombinase XerD